MDIITPVITTVLNRLISGISTSSSPKTAVSETAIKDLEQRVEEILRKNHNITDINEIKNAIQELHRKIAEISVNPIAINEDRNYEPSIKESITMEEILKVIKDFDTAGIRPKGVNPYKFSKRLYDFLRRPKV